LQLIQGWLIYPDPNHTYTTSGTFCRLLGKTATGLQTLHGRCFTGFVYGIVLALWSCWKQNVMVMNKDFCKIELHKNEKSPFWQLQLDGNV